jgi:hypothetical protein
MRAQQGANSSAVQEITMSDTETKEPKYRTISLSGRAPVRIREDQWPQIAHGSYEDFDNQYKFQANRTTDIDIRVRKHEDGRAIVYGVYDYSTNFQGERGLVVRTGKLCEPGEDLAEAIQAVGEEMIERLEDRADAANVRDVIAGCIADLPAEDL